MECLKSICSIHNETLNIWTHLIPAILSLLFQFQLWSLEGISWTELILLSLPALGGMVTLTSSVLCHTFECHNDFEKWYMVDILGIHIGLLSELPTLIYFGLWHQHFLRRIYMSVFIIAFTYIIWLFFKRPDQFYKDRILWISGWIVGSLIILCHIITIDTDGSVVERHVSTYFLGVAFVGFGAIFYILSFPENVLPVGFVDLIGQSHNFWHIASYIFHAMTLNFNHKVANKRIEPDCLQKLIFWVNWTVSLQWCLKIYPKEIQFLG